ncbi:hypothetical protein, partial [Turicibacter sanguinis]
AIQKYNLSETEANLLFDTLYLAGEIKDLKQNSSDSLIKPRFEIKGFTLYFTHSEVVMYLSSVAMVGPAGVVAAVIAAATLLTGPIGGTVAGIIAGVSSTALYLQVMDAIATGKGLYVGAAGIGTW